MAKTKHSWDRLDPLNVGDEKPEDIFLNVGISLSWFEELQLSMTMLFQRLIRGDLIAIIRSFGVLDSVPPKAEMIQEASKVRFFEDVNKQKAIGNLMTQFKALSHRRNEIAHGKVSSTLTDPTLTGYFLHPGLHSTSRNSKMFTPEFHPMGDYRYTAAQIKHYTDEFRRLDEEVHRFMEALDASDRTSSPQASQKKPSGPEDVDTQG